MTTTRRYVGPEEWLRTHPDTIGRTLLYAMLRSGEFPSIRVGRRFLVPDDALDVLLERQRRKDDDA